MNKLKQSSVVFNEVEHTYTLRAKNLSGITSVLSKHLFKNKFDGVPSSVLENARVRGVIGHSDLEMYDKMGLFSSENEALIKNYIEFKKKYEINVLENEYLISDEENFATKIDMVDENFNIFDYKFNSAIDIMYLRWQLSICAYLFKLQNGFEPHKLFCIQIDKEDNFTLIEIEPIDEEKVVELLNAEVNGLEYVSNEVLSISQETETLALLESTINDFQKQIDEISEKRDALKNIIREQMIASGIKTFNAGSIKITNVEDSEATTFDSKAFKAENEELYSQYLKKSIRKGYLKITSI